MSPKITASDSGNLLRTDLSGLTAINTTEPMKATPAIAAKPHQPTRYLIPSPAKRVNSVG